MNTIIKNADEVHARGRFVKVIGEERKGMSAMALSMNEYFSKHTQKVYDWAKLGLDYCGG